MRAVGGADRAVFADADNAGAASLPAPLRYNELVLAAFSDTDADAAWPALMARFEMALLEEVGFGLDLSCCAATGVVDELEYVSPRSGRAVSRAAAQPYVDKMFVLPQFLLDPSANASYGGCAFGAGIDRAFSGAARIFAQWAENAAGAAEIGGYAGTLITSQPPNRWINRAMSDVDDLPSGSYSKPESGAREPLSGLCAFHHYQSGFARCPRRLEAGASSSAFCDAAIAP
jgi:hypothetical protein